MTRHAERLAALPAEQRAEAAARLDRFVALFLRWNRSIQMAAVKDADAVLHHVDDSLALLPHLAVGARVVDVGAGGGFPGAVLALTRPDLEVTSLEPIHKKHAFLATAKRELGLAGYLPLVERDDTHRARPGFDPYDVAVSRATFSVADWLDRGLDLVRPGGLVIAMEGRDQHDLPPATVRHAYPLGDRQRALLLRTRPPT